MEVFKKVLRKRFMHAYFTGEHLADWQGFMEGAINTGEAAAEWCCEGELLREKMVGAK
jgi:monoamine oxidase